MKKKVENILGEQLELLAEASRKKHTTQQELSNLSMAMVAISGELRVITGAGRLSFDLAQKPDKYELRPLAEKHEQEY